MSYKKYINHLINQPCLIYNLVNLKESADIGLLMFIVLMNEIHELLVMFYDNINILRYIFTLKIYLSYSLQLSLAPA